LASTARNIDEWQDYFDAIEEMAQSGHFDIVGHLDLIKIFKFMPTKNILDIANNALIAIKKSGMSIEINAAGLRKPIAQTYPSTELLQKIKEMGIDITFGSDAHAPSQVALFDEEILKTIQKIGFTQFTYYKNRKKYFVNIPYV
jgi:histidinol-phosphatase (PHP family)